MRSIKARFKRFKKESPNELEYKVFARAVRGQRFCHKRVIEGFNELVELDDFDRERKKYLIEEILRINDC